MLTNNLADGGGTVQCRPNHYPAFNTRQKKTIDTAAIDVNKFVSKSRNCPYHGWKVRGKAIATIVGGEVRFEA